MFTKSNLRAAESLRNRWVAIVPSDDRSQLSDPRYWSAVAPNFSKFDVIEVHAQDGMFWAELLVIETNANFCKVQPINLVDLERADPNEEEMLNGLVVKHYGNIKQWTVIDSRGKHLRDRFNSRGAALAWAVEYNEKLQAA